jgi:hypothetical protein
MTFSPSFYTHVARARVRSRTSSPVEYDYGRVFLTWHRSRLIFKSLAYYSTLQPAAHRRPESDEQ